MQMFFTTYHTILFYCIIEYYLIINLIINKLMRRITSKTLLLTTSIEQEVKIHFCSDLLCIKVINNILTLFFNVITDATIITRNYVIICTEDDIPNKSIYIDTIVIDGVKEYHLFELL